MRCDPIFCFCFYNHSGISSTCNWSYEVQAYTDLLFSIVTKLFSDWLHNTILFWGKWLWSPTNIKGANRDAKIYIRRSTIMHKLLFCAYSICMNYVTKTFLLVSSLVRSEELLCFVHGQGQKSEQRPTTKKFVWFHNHSPLLNIITPSKTSNCNNNNN